MDENRDVMPQKTSKGDLEITAKVHIVDYEQEQEKDYAIGLRTWLAVLALAFATSCAVVSTTTNTTIKWQVATVGDPQLSSWIANGNLLVSVAFGPIVGSLGDRLGKKWFVIGGCVTGTVGSCLSASAPKISRIIGGNILTGLANAGCILSMSANQEIVTNERRPLAMGVSQTIGSAFSIAGTFIAGAVVKYNVGGHGGWRWAYYINAILYGAAGLCVYITYFPPPPEMRRRHQLKEILLGVDFGGIILLCGSLTALILGLTWGGSTHPWNSAEVVSTLTCGCVGLFIVGLYEWLIKKDGIFDHRLMQSRNFPILQLICTVDGMMLLGVNVLYAQEIPDMFTQDTVKIALLLLPYLATSTFGCGPAGWLMARTKSYRALLVTALLWCALFVGLMALVKPNKLAIACVFSALLGMATAVTTVIPITAIALSVPSFLIGTAGTLSTSARALGGIIGITIFTAIYNNKLAHHLVEDVSAIVITQGFNDTVLEEILQIAASPDPSVLGTLGLPASLVNGVERAISQARVASWTYVWVAMGAFVATSAVAACFLQPVAHKMNSHIESALEHSQVRKAQFNSEV